MTWNAMGLGIVIFACTVGGMFLGAWFAARGFEKSLVDIMNDPDVPWNKDT